MALVRLLNSRGKLIQRNILTDSDKDKLFTEIYSEWKRETGSKSFQDWADDLNESGEFDGEFSADDAIDNFRSMYGPAFNIGTKHADIYAYFRAQFDNATK